MNKPGFYFFSVLMLLEESKLLHQSFCCPPGECSLFSGSTAGPKLGPFVQTNVTTCKLFLAQKSSLRDLIFGLVSPARAHAHVLHYVTSPFSQTTRPSFWKARLGFGLASSGVRERGSHWQADGMSRGIGQTHLTKGSVEQHASLTCTPLCEHWKYFHPVINTVRH